MKKNLTFSSLPFSGRLLLAAFTVTLAAWSSTAQVANPGFESGTNSWVETGGSGNFSTPTSYVGVYQTVNPVQGSHFGLISNDGVDTETISQSFLVGPGTQYLDFNYRFLTDEYNDPAFNDTAYATLTPTVGSPTTLFSVSRNDLQADGAGPLLPGASYIDVQTIGQSSWQSFSTDISAYAGQLVTLSFSVNNDGDPDDLLDSQLAVDNVQVVPEPGPATLLAGGLGLLAVIHRWRNRHTPTL